MEILDFGWTATEPTATGCVQLHGARLEHGYTRGSQVRDPYPYPWDTHYPNTSVGLHTGTDPQTRVAVRKSMKTPVGVYPSMGTPAGTHDIATQ